ncbi:MAG: hypothetical protein R3F42_02230 [Pseudomonadota bacterium]
MYIKTVFRHLLAVVSRNPTAAKLLPRLEAIASCTAAARAAEPGFVAV